MKHYYYKRPTNLGAIIIILVSLIIVTLLLLFLLDTVTYIMYTLKIHAIERDAAQGYWSANGFVTWTDSLTEAYNAAKLQKEVFISNSNVGNFLYHCGYSLLGEFIRIVVIVAAVPFLVISLEMTFKSAKFLSKSLAGYPVHSVRRVSSYRYR